MTTLRQIFHRTIGLPGICLAVLISSAAAQTAAEPETSATAHAPRLNGTLTIVGSDTMAELMQAWLEQLHNHQPGIRVQLHASGSSTAPPALIRGTTAVGAMSRPMNDNERRDFVIAHGYPPTELPVALDAIAVVVNHGNPLNELSLPQAAAIFTANGQCRSALPGINGWDGLLGAADLTGHPLHGRSIQRFGRNAASGTYQWFRENVLCGADYRAAVNSLPGNGAIVTAVEQSANGIGYAGVAFLTAGVKALALSADSTPAVVPSLDAIRAGGYPLTRRLYLYANRPPGRRFIPEVKALLELIYSPAGQATVNRVGLVALPDAEVEVITTQYLSDPKPPG